MLRKLKKYIFIGVLFILFGASCAQASVRGKSDPGICKYDDCLSEKKELTSDEEEWLVDVRTFVFSYEFIRGMHDRYTTEFGSVPAAVHQDLIEADAAYKTLKSAFGNCDKIYNQEMSNMFSSHFFTISENLLLSRNYNHNTYYENSLKEIRRILNKYKYSCFSHDNLLSCYLNVKNIQNLETVSKGLWDTIIKDPNFEVEKKLTEYELDIISAIASEKAISIFQKINKNWEFTNDNISPILNAPESWRIENIITNNGRSSVLIWRKDKEQNLASAIQEAIEYKITAECSNAARIARIAIICHILGKKATEQWIKSTNTANYKIDFNFMSKLSWSFVEKKTDNLHTLNEAGIYAVPFVNIQEYALYKPDGAASNINLIRLKDGTFTGFEPSFHGNQVSYDDVEKFLYECFISESDVKDELKNAHKEFVKNLTFKKFITKRRAYQRNVGYYKFDLEKMIKLRKSQ